MRPVVRMAFVVSHPIQYYVPLYRLLATRDDVAVRVFFTWHAAEAPMTDPGFAQKIAWDIPLTEGYDYEFVPPIGSDTGPHRFLGLRNPGLIPALLRWNPSIVHVTGYAHFSHLRALLALRRRGIPALFRGDSHLLDPESPIHRLAKQTVLRRLFSLPSAFLYVGRSNLAYYQAFGVPESRLFRCPHSIDCARFTASAEEREAEAQTWRRSLGIADHEIVFLFVGKFEPKKRSVELARVFSELEISDARLVLCGDGPLIDSLRQIASEHGRRITLLPFQNQSRMPIVHRLGDVLVLPSAYRETWGLAVNEAMACGRPALVSNRVGCAADLVTPFQTGLVFKAEDWSDVAGALKTAGNTRDQLPSWGRAARNVSLLFDIPHTASTLVEAARAVLGNERRQVQVEAKSAEP
jgi:glycosyltransferase involved in cell wall biosynthesis